MESSAGRRAKVSRFVLDASIALAWCFDDESTSETNALIDRLRDYGAYVPSLWHLELTNVLLQAERRSRISAADIAVRLRLLGDLPIDTDVETHLRAMRETLALARAERLTAYDAAYLELAMRRGLPLASRDGDLRAAAARLGVVVLPS